MTFGRFLLAVLFIVSGAMKLLDIAAAMQLTQKIVLPAVAAPYVAQLESAAGMPLPQILAIAAGVLELVAGLLMAFNIAARFFAIVLILFVVAATYYVHPFWMQSGAEADTNLQHALKNMALVGALFIVAGIGKGRRAIDAVYGEG